MRYIYAPAFNMSTPTIPLSDIRQRRFNLIDRAQSMAMRELSMQGMPANEAAVSSLRINKFEFILALDDNPIIDQAVEKLCYLD